MFSGCCEKKFEVEPVEVIYSDGKSYVCPDLSLYDMKVPLSYINDTIGISLEANEVMFAVAHFGSLVGCCPTDIRIDDFVQI